MRRLIALMLAAATSPAAAVSLTGVNLAGAEFGGLNGVHGYQYIYPNEAEMQAFKALGMNVFRVPVRWERLQPALSGNLAAAEIARLDKVINFATALDISVIIDIHNYGRYARQPIGSPAVPPIRGSSSG
jgi:endoglucanase